MFRIRIQLQAWSESLPKKKKNEEISVSNVLCETKKFHDSNVLCKTKQVHVLNVLCWVGVGGFSWILNVLCWGTVRYRYLISYV